MQGNGKSKMKVAILVLSVLLAVSLLLLARTLIYNYVAEAQSASVTVPDNIITPEDDGNSSQSDESPNSGASVSAVPSQTPTASQSASQSASDPTGADVKATALSLYSRKPDDNTPFRVANLFPGDSETKYFCVRVSHKGDVLLRFHAQVRPGYEKLAEVLKCRVVLPESGEVLYDGRMRDMPESLSHALHTGASTTGEVYYAVTAYLDTGVGNAYMDKDLIADFRWWVEETENLDNPKTGDAFRMDLWIAVAVGSLFLLILLWRKREKEDAADEG